MIETSVKKRVKGEEKIISVKGLFRFMRKREVQTIYMYGPLKVYFWKKIETEFSI